MTYTYGLSGLPDPPVLSTMTDALAGIAVAHGQAGSSTTWPSAATALFFPVRLSQRRTYTRAWWLNGATAAGNVDVGIYTISGTTATRVVASTAEAQAGVSAMQVAATFTTTTIGPGLYYLAMSMSLATGTVWKTSPSATGLKLYGCFQASTAHPLPATATVAAFTTAGTVPVFGFSERTTI